MYKDGAPKGHVDGREGDCFLLPIFVLGSLPESLFVEVFHTVTYAFTSIHFTLLLVVLGRSAL